MTRDARFGLPLSLVEALQADPSPEAAALADLLREGDAPPSPQLQPRPRRETSWRTAFAGLSLALSVGAHGYAATPSLEGRWTMAPGASSFQEGVTGPAPDKAVVVVTRDDPEGLAYEIVESRRGAEVARGAYRLSFTGARSTSWVDGAQSDVTAERDAAGAVVIRAPEVGGLRLAIHVRRTGQDTALIEHAVEGPNGSTTIERFSLVRSKLALRD